MPKLLVIVPGADMRCRLPGLWMHAKASQNLRPEMCKPGDVLIFVNNARTHVAAIAITPTRPRGVLLFDESESGRIEPLAIKHLPECLGGGELNLTKATEKALAELLPEYERRGKKDV